MAEYIYTTRIISDFEVWIIQILKQIRPVVSYLNLPHLPIGQMTLTNLWTAVIIEHGGAVMKNFQNSPEIFLEYIRNRPDLFSYVESKSENKS